MRAAVCDDNVIFLEEMRRELCCNHGFEEVRIYSEIETFFESIENEEKYDIVFLDLDWKEGTVTGLELGEKLYELAPHIPVILVTGYNDRFAQHILLTKMNLIGYLTKPVDKELIERYIRKAWDSRKQVQYLNISCQGKSIRIQADKIIHIESHNHKIHIFTENESYEVYEKLSDILKRLPKDFVQCHKSFLVNLNWISSIEGKEIIMQSDKHIPISRTYQENIRERFFEFMGENL